MENQSDGLPTDVKKAILSLIEYSWEDELRDYIIEAQSGTPEGHIFTDLLMVDNFISGRNLTIEDYTGASPDEENYEHS